MPRRTGEKRELRHMGFRTPQEVFDDLETIARFRGSDVSSVLNSILAEHRPRLLRLKAEHEAALLEAAASRVWARQPSTAEALRVLRELLGRLQEEYAALTRQALDEDARRAA